MDNTLRTPRPQTQTVKSARAYLFVHDWDFGNIVFKPVFGFAEKLWLKQFYELEQVFMIVFKQVFNNEFLIH
jgi:hypothetical protein